MPRLSCASMRGARSRATGEHVDTHTSTTTRVARWHNKQWWKSYGSVRLLNGFAREISVGMDIGLFADYVVVNSAFHRYLVVQWTRYVRQLSCAQYREDFLVVDLLHLQFGWRGSPGWFFPVVTAGIELSTQYKQSTLKQDRMVLEHTPARVGTTEEPARPP